MKKQNNHFSRLLARAGGWWLGRAARRTEVSAPAYQSTLDARTALRLERWVSERGYCRPDMGMEAVAESLGISKEQLSYYCRAVLGLNFLSWRKQLRMREAQRLLASSPGLSVLLVSEMVGVSDKSNFKRQFYEVCGCTPAQWVAQQRR